MAVTIPSSAGAKGASSCSGVEAVSYTHLDVYKRQVCLISESLSRESGLNVGVTLPLSLYEFDRDLLYSFLTEYNPRSSLYLPDRGFQQETEYTVIGPVSYTHLDVYKRQVFIPSRSTAVPHTPTRNPPRAVRYPRLRVSPAA